MLALPIFIVQVHLYAVAPEVLNVVEEKTGDHANEMENEPDAASEAGMGSPPRDRR